MIKLKPIATVKNSRKKIKDDDWEDIVSEIILDLSLVEECLKGIEAFSHLEIVYYFHKVNKTKISYDSRYPRNDKKLEKVGIFAQRGKNRPNQIGLTIVKFVKKEGRSLFVRGLDAINGSPVLDIKPVIKEFLPMEPIKQPVWVSKLMQDYWKIQK